MTLPDDLPGSAETILLDLEAFETVRENVAAGADRWVGALVRDGNGRVVLVRNRWSDGWVLPGGDVEPGESLGEAVAREVREETGLDATVERPLEVVEQTFVADESSAPDEAHRANESSAPDEATAGATTVSGQFVVFEMRTDDSALGDELGRDDDEIADAAWFDAVPAECEHRSLLTRHW